MRVVVILAVCAITVLSRDPGPVIRFLGEYSGESKADLLARRNAMAANAQVESPGRFADVHDARVDSGVTLTASPPAIHAEDTVNITWWVDMASFAFPGPVIRSLSDRPAV